MPLINELETLEYTQKTKVYKDLQDTLLEIFAFDTYTDKEDLQRDFEELLHDPQYITILEEFIEKYPSIHIDLDRLYKGITPKRWKLCAQCKKPYLDYSTYNRTVVCYNKIYKRYAMTTREYFKSTDRVSQCYMDSKSAGYHKYNSRTS